MCQPPVKNRHHLIKIYGRVQGVGFRPFVYALATELGLRGSVLNNGHGVEIEISGSEPALNIFLERLHSQRPAQARIEQVVVSITATPLRSNDFTIKPSIEAGSEAGAAVEKLTAITPDLATCKQCLNELFDTDDRRYLHPFITCTNCGPRASIITSLPYDRSRTSMSIFEMCPLCLNEYNHSSSPRRFHSQGNACPQCGPRLRLVNSKESKSKSLAHAEHNQKQQPFEFCAEQLKNGAIIAVKGIGGFHLICDAQNPEAIKRLRDRKRRPDKPFAIMALNTSSLESQVYLDEADKVLLNQSQAPIVLLRKKYSRADKASELIAPGVPDLACLLPYTPVHYLLFHALSAKPDGHTWLNLPNEHQLVVTSANRSGEPIIADETLEMVQLKQLADFVLFNDRQIIASSDDSVIQPGSPATVIRRARGLAPDSIELTRELPQVLACGAHLKNTFCFTKGKSAHLSPYIGELDSPQNYQHFKDAIEHYSSLLGINIEALSCDLHPDYVSTYFAEKYSQEKEVPLIRVQHHRAHIAALMADKGLDLENTKALALVLDGTGLGDDQSAWGGELFFCRNAAFQHIGQFEKLDLPGGDIASREIWRIGASLLAKLNLGETDRRYSKQLNDNLTKQFILGGKHTVSSSAGRWFDAIASLIGLRQTCSYEAQAAMEFEALCEEPDQLKAKSHMIITDDNTLMLSPTIPHLLKYAQPAEAAIYFFQELVDGLTRWVSHAAVQHQSKTVLCSGGCFQNRLLRESLEQSLTSSGFQVYFPKLTPANDGGISLGQALVAGHQLLSTSTTKNL